ncbi:SDR family NAD(P)-dependent oxidoreductase [Streptomyces sp. NPDC050625]|uniref:SDR family NAD(P)-dependent oxidoreductase n=1 Tax=Streptomyces sp. NPDC050625 TaxID=3154629 RepID=UPI003427442A
MFKAFRRGRSSFMKPGPRSKRDVAYAGDAPRRALVTGPTSGIGLAYAEELAGRGIDLVLVSRDQERLTSVAVRLRHSHGIQTEVLAADLATSEGLGRAARRIQDQSRPVDLVINNAGALPSGVFGATDIADEDRLLDLLVRAPMHLTDAALKAMCTRGHGRVINVCSVAAWTPRGSYGAHKAWLLSLSRWANMSYAGSGLRILAVCPGFVRTELHHSVDRSGVPRWMWLEASTVVQQSLRDLEKGKDVSTPSLRYKAFGLAVRHLPWPLVRRIAA